MAEPLATGWAGATAAGGAAGTEAFQRKVLDVRKIVRSKTNSMVFTLPFVPASGPPSVSAKGGNDSDRFHADSVRLPETNGAAR